MKFRLAHFSLSLIGAVIVTPLVMAQSYTPNYVYIGSFDSDGGTVDVSYDLNQSHDTTNEGTMVAIKGTVPNQAFYDHHILAPDRFNYVANGDMRPVYFSEGARVDCGRKVMREGHTVYYNAENQMVADHDDGLVPETIVPGSLGFVVMQKICGS